MKTNSVSLKRVHFMPMELSPGLLYFSEEFGMAAHLCACGCGKKVFTPVGRTDWELSVKNDKPTLYPSVGSWQLECQSHYWIWAGRIECSGAWTEEQIIAGRHEEEQRRELYYKERGSETEKPRLVKRFVEWFLKLFKR